MKTSPRALVGLVLAGYGLLVLAGVLPHDALAAGVVSLAAGVILLAWGLPHVTLPRGRLVGALGIAATTGVVAYNVLRGSGLSAPEWGILLYGLALVAAAPLLQRRVRGVALGTIVGWSFPLLLAPLALFALNASLSDGTGAAATPLVEALVVAPTAVGLALVGTPVDVAGTNLLLTTPRGSLTLGVGLVCAGLYPMVLFGGLVGLHAWEQRLPRRRLATALLLGFGGLWVLNVLRLVVLARVGIAWGPEALQTTHAHMGWVLYGAFMLLFWAVVLRRWETAPPAAIGSSAPPP